MCRDTNLRRDVGGHVELALSTDRTMRAVHAAEKRQPARGRSQRCSLASFPFISHFRLSRVRYGSNSTLETKLYPEPTSFTFPSAAQGFVAREFNS